MISIGVFIGVKYFCPCRKKISLRKVKRELRIDNLNEIRNARNVLPIVRDVPPFEGRGESYR